MLQEIIALDQKYYMNTFGNRRPVCFDHGVGMKLYTENGEAYLDFFAGIAVNAIGYSHPKFVCAVKEQIEKLIHTSSLYYIESQALLAQKLCKISCADRAFFCNSGAEANEAALKLAKIYFYKKGQPERNRIITLENSFHGRTLATVAATGQRKYQEPYRPLTPGFSHVKINDVDALNMEVTDQTAAIMIELIQGESGVYSCSREFLQAVQQLCSEKGILLIVDEVQTGIGRTGAMFAYQNFGIEPDIFTLAKALGGGIPIGAVCAKQEVCAFEPGDHGSTFGGNPLATTAALSVLDIIENEKLVGRAARMGAYFKDSLTKLQNRYTCLKEIRGMGLMIGVEFEAGLAPQIHEALFQNRILCGCVGNTLRILPPLIVTEEEIDIFTQALEDILRNLRQ